MLMFDSKVFLLRSTMTTEPTLECSKQGIESAQHSEISTFLDFDTTTARASLAVHRRNPNHSRSLGMQITSIVSRRNVAERLRRLCVWALSA